MRARSSVRCTVSMAGLLFAASVAAEPTVVGFDDGAEGWAWNGGEIPLEGDGGHPGAHAHLAAAGIGSVSLATEKNTAFIGDFSASKGVSVGLDAKVEALLVNGNPGSRDLIVEFRSRALAADGYPWASVWADLGVLQAGPDWDSYSITFDPRSSSLPEGWHGSGAEDPVTFEPVLPSGVTFADVLAQTDELVFTTEKPGFVFGAADFDLRIDNLRIDRTAGPEPTPPPQYEIVDLGTFGGQLANAHDINDAGHVAGTADDPDEVPQAFLWSDGTLNNLGSLMPGNVPDYGVARGMSENDYVVGESMTPAQGFPGASVSHAFFWSAPTGMIDITPGVDNMSQAWDVNSAGQVVGNYIGAFIWSQQDGLRNIGLGAGGSAEGINENGQVCGYEWNAEGTHQVGWVYDSKTDTIRELPSLGGHSETRRINDAGDVVGYSNDADRAPHTVMWTADDEIVDLGPAPAPDFSPGIANAINNARWIVGTDYYNGFGVPPMGWLWIDGSKYELRALIADPAQREAWSELSTPLGINAQGEIVGIGVRDGIPGRSFLMRPIGTGTDRIFGDGFETD